MSTPREFPNHAPLSDTNAADQRAEREAFTINLLRWQSEAPTYGLNSSQSAPDGQSPTAALSPAEELSAIIRQAATRVPQWDSQRLTASAQETRERGAPLAQDAHFFTQSSIMNIISHAIEERVIAERCHCDIYAGFQRLALVEPQLRRYRALADVSRHVFLYGIDDIAGNPNILGLGPHTTLRFTIRPELQTGMELFWFVVVDDPRMPTALLAQHTEGDLWSSRQANRRYYGIWTFDPTLVAQIIETLRRAARILYYGAPA